MTCLKPGYEDTRYHYFTVDPTKKYTHLRLNIYPDGGVARLRTYGVMVPPSPEKLLRYEINGKSLVDLVAMDNGGVCQGLSDAHYGHPRNLIKKNRGFNMADGWETARRQDRPSVLKVSIKYFKLGREIQIYFPIYFEKYILVQYNLVEKPDQRKNLYVIELNHILNTYLWSWIYDTIESRYTVYQIIF